MGASQLTRAVFDLVQPPPLVDRASRMDHVWKEMLAARPIRYPAHSGPIE